MPRLGITLGDPRGIGPEVTAAALSSFSGLDGIEPVLVGPRSLGEVEGRLEGVPREAVGDWDPAGGERLAGALSGRAIERAVALARTGEIDGIVTAPISKAALRAAGYTHPGHTEFLQELAGAPEVTMMMSAERTPLGGPLRLALLTAHLPLRDVPSVLDVDLFARRSGIAIEALRAWWRIERPRLAFAGLNPHAGEGGLFGDEEIEVFAPALARLACDPRRGNPRRLSRGHTLRLPEGDLRGGGPHRDTLPRRGSRGPEDDRHERRRERDGRSSLPAHVSRSRHGHGHRRTRDRGPGSDARRDRTLCAVLRGPGRRAMISLRNVSKVYGPSGAALEGVSFRLRKGEFAFLTGPSGAGKSTVLELIHFQTRPTEGEVQVSRYNSRRVRRRDIPELRRRVGFVFQDFKLLERLTAAENVAFALEVVGTPRREIGGRVQRLLSQVGLAARARSRPSELSGGERQRVAVARALATEPRILLADEPTGNLDPDAAAGVFELFRTLNRLGTAVLMATHDAEFVRRQPEIRRLELEHGRLVRDSAA